MSILRRPSGVLKAPKSAIVTIWCIYILHTYVDFSLFFMLNTNKHISFCVKLFWTLFVKYISTAHAFPSPPLCSDAAPAKLKRLPGDMVEESPYPWEPFTLLPLLREKRREIIVSAFSLPTAQKVFKWTSDMDIRTQFIMYSHGSKVAFEFTFQGKCRLIFFPCMYSRIRVWRWGICMHGKRKIKIWRKGGGKGMGETVPWVKFNPTYLKLYSMYMFFVSLGHRGRLPRKKGWETADRAGIFQKKKERKNLHFYLVCMGKEQDLGTL